MKKTILYLFILFLTISCAQKRIISQAEPFENTITAINKSAWALFQNSFSQQIQNDNSETLPWNKRLQVAEERLTLKFGELKTKDFSYKYDADDSMLTITHKTNESFKVHVVLENGEWKLNEH